MVTNKLTVHHIDNRIAPKLARGASGLTADRSQENFLVSTSYKRMYSADRQFAFNKGSFVC